VNETLIQEGVLQGNFRLTVSAALPGMFSVEPV